MLSVLLALASAPSMPVFPARGAATDPPGAVGALPVVGGVACERVGVCVSSTARNGEAWAGDGLAWITDFSAQRLRLVDTRNGCAEIRSCVAPGGGQPSELTLLGGVLYHYDFQLGLLFRIDPLTCQLLGFCDPPGDDLAEGLTNDGQHLWRGDSQNLYRFDPQTCQVLQVCPNPPGDSADGLTMCGNYLVMLGYSGRVYQIDPSTCAVVSSCALSQGAAGNGITSDRLADLFVDQPGGIDRVNLSCEAPFGEPLCSAPAAVMGSVGVPLVFTVSGQSTSGVPGASVTLSVTGLPPGAAMNPPLPLTGQPAVSQFAWTPSGAQAGTFVVTFTVTDPIGGTRSCSTTITIAECHQLVGSGGGGTDLVIFGQPFHTDLSAVRRTWPVTMDRRPSLVVPRLVTGEVRFSVQTLMHNPHHFPANPDQWSRRMEVVIRPGMLVAGESFGTANGIHQSLATYLRDDGRLAMTFPFTIDGM
ncbi:MAG: hypothetical protein JNK02_07935 [Planctomycetes bacterium]|nr:hypothetical protein [Planctomycetota bacterium]